MKSNKYTQLVSGPEVQVPLITHICVSRETSSDRDSSLRNLYNKVRELEMWRNVRSQLKHIGRRRLCLLVFIWTCTCLMLFKLALLFAYIDARQTSIEMTPRQARALATSDSVMNTRHMNWHSSRTHRHSTVPVSGRHIVPHKAALAKAIVTATVNGCRYTLPSRTELDISNTYWQRLVTRAQLETQASISSESPVASGAPMTLSSLSASPGSGASSPPTSGSSSNATTAISAATTNDEKLLPGQTTFHLYAAYYDNRWRQGGASVRILSMIDRVHPTPTKCLLWFNANEASNTTTTAPITVAANYMYAWYPKWGNYKDAILQPFIVTCPLPKTHAQLVPTSVSLMERDAGTWSVAPSMQSINTSASTSTVRMSADKQCPRLNNNLRILNERPSKRQRFGVCVKGLEFLYDDISVRLVEWIELLHMLGASKIFLYELDVHPNISKVLRHYQQRGIVQLTKITLAGQQPNEPELRHQYLKSHLTHKRQNELIAYNDCLYRNLYSYDYLALLDIDEVIMPIMHKSWNELMQHVEADALREHNYTRASYNVRNVYFFDDLAGAKVKLNEATQSERRSPTQLMKANANVDRERNDIPSYMHMLRHVFRSRNYTAPGQYVKCFHNTQRAVSLHNHFPLNCFGQCTTYSIPTSLAHLQHYRKDCVGPLRQTCQNEFRAFTVRDTTIWRYKQAMIERTTRALLQLKLLAPDDAPSFGA